MYPLYVRYCKSPVFVDHEVMSVYIFQLILKKYNLYGDFAKYGLGKDVVLICEGSSVGNPFDL